MRVAHYINYGPPDVVHIANVAKPVPKDNEILVRVHATTVCATDAAVRSAASFLFRFMAGILKPRKPVVGGVEFSGRVVEVGKDVTRFSIGDLIFGIPGTQGGAHAEFLHIPESGAVQHKPVNMSLDEAAAIAGGGLTALGFLKLAKIEPGQNVLIYGASGAVGVLAVQLAKHFGARVTGVCGPTNLELVRSLGADVVVDYTKDDFSTAGPVYDVIVDTVGKSGFARSLRALKRGGTYVLISIAGLFLLGPEKLWASVTSAVKIIGPFSLAFSVSSSALAAELAILKELIEVGELKAVIGRRYPFAQIAQAHAYVDTGHKVGNALVVMDETDSA
jgi:NADPH:quinone reductase-like Zn-dependent oxidoreductase